MNKTVEEYLTELKQALQGCDAATLQDALADAEEHLRNALESARAANPSLNEAAAVAASVEEFGTPDEIAAAYKMIEKRQPPTLAPQPRRRPQSLLGRFFGVLVDPRAWGALLYLMISLLSGILYFTWGVTGLSLSAGMIVLVIGVPFFALFMVSVRGIGLIEGRIVEALLGLRMPRRPIFVDARIGWWARFKNLIASWATWKTLMYMLLQLPLGVISFSLFTTLITIGLSLVAAPIVELFHLGPVITIANNTYHLEWWSWPLFAAAGLITMVLTLHLAKLLGSLHGRFAKWMLVSE